MLHEGQRRGLSLDDIRVNVGGVGGIHTLMSYVVLLPFMLTLLDVDVVAATVVMLSPSLCSPSRTAAASGNAQHRVRRRCRYVQRRSHEHVRCCRRYSSQAECDKTRG